MDFQQPLRSGRVFYRSGYVPDFTGGEVGKTSYEARQEPNEKKPI